MSETDTGRWFKVIGPRFDWIIRPTLMRSWKKDEIGFAPKAAIEIGLATGAIETIRKPANAYVGKDGQVHTK